jgi:hypothetical protein
MDPEYVDSMKGQKGVKGSLYPGRENVINVLI